MKPFYYPIPKRQNAKLIFPTSENNWFSSKKESWQVTRCFFLQPKRAACRSTFHVSGSPGRHQWLQSVAIIPLYPSGCASFLYCESVVTSRKYTGFFILLKTLFTITQAIGVPAGYFNPKNGSVSLMQDLAGWFQSFPLLTTSNTHHAQLIKTKTF